MTKLNSYNPSVRKINKSNIILILVSAILMIPLNKSYSQNDSVIKNQEIDKLLSEKYKTENEMYKAQTALFKKQKELSEIEIKKQSIPNQTKSPFNEFIHAIITTPLFFTGIFVAFVSLLTYRASIKNQKEVYYLELIKRLGDSSPAVRSNAVIALSTFINSIYRTRFLFSNKHISTDFLLPSISQLASNSITESDPRVLRRISKILIILASKELTTSLDELRRTNKPLQEHLHDCIIRYLVYIHDIKSHEEAVDKLDYIFTDIQKQTGAHSMCLQNIIRRRYKSTNLNQHLMSQHHIKKLHSPTSNTQDLEFKLIQDIIQELQIANERLSSHKMCLLNVLKNFSNKENKEKIEMTSLYLGGVMLGTKIEESYFHRKEDEDTVKENGDTVIEEQINDPKIKSEFRFINFDFELCIFSNSEWYNTDFEDCDFTRCRMHNMIIKNCTFTKCIFNDTELYGTNFEYCKFTESQLYKGLFSRPFLGPPSKNDLLDSIIIKNELSNTIISYNYSDFIFKATKTIIAPLMESADLEPIRKEESNLKIGSEEENGEDNKNSR